MKTRLVIEQSATSNSSHSLILSIIMNTIVSINYFQSHTRPSNCILCKTARVE